MNNKTANENSTASDETRQNTAVTRHDWRTMLQTLYAHYSQGNDAIWENKRRWKKYTRKSK